jgi:enoyl-CoA hydratase/carnithine racemase
VVPSEKLIEEVNTLTASLVNGPPIALAAAKKLVNSGLQLETGLASEAASFGRIFSSADAKEGMAAFVQKRKPVFKGE